MTDHNSTALVPVHHSSAARLKITEMEFDSAFAAGRFTIEGGITVEVSDIENIEVFARIVAAVRGAVEAAR